MRDVAMIEAVTLNLQLRRHHHDNTRRNKDVNGKAGNTNETTAGVAADDCFNVSVTAIPL